MNLLDCDSAEASKRILGRVVLPALQRISSALPDLSFDSDSSSNLDLEMFHLLKLLQHIGKLQSVVGGTEYEPIWASFVASCSDFLLQVRFWYPFEDRSSKLTNLACCSCQTHSF
jgi:hypothetical protein